MKKTLIILRHGKAETAKPAQEDHERILAERGIKAAKRMGRYLKEENLVPQKVMCSSATRTVETLMKLEAGYREPLPVEYSDKLYMATENQLLQIVAAQPDTVNSLMLIGHNPGMHELAVRLSSDGDKKDLEQVRAAFPTCALAIVELKNWQDKRGELKLFVTPKTLPE